MRIKLCGMSRECDIDYANEASPDYIGFVINFPKSHRSISPERAAELRRRLRPEINAVGVFVNSSEATCADMAECGIIDLIQLHGSEDAAYIARLRALTRAPIIKAVKVTRRADIDAALALGADYLLLDSGTGSGRAFDHSLIPQGLPIPFFLAGGLTPDNIAQAVQTVRPFAVDMSSGIESDGFKDRDKMIRAVTRARAL